MANLGSEVSRILEWKAKGDMDMALKCRQRADKIFQDIVSDSTMLKRVAEMQILGELIDDLFADEPKYTVHSSSLKSYFYPFASSVLSQNNYV